MELILKLVKIEGENCIYEIENAQALAIEEGMSIPIDFSKWEVLEWI